MKHTIYFFNDRKIPANVRIQETHKGEPIYDHKIIKPASGELIVVNLDTNQIPFVKIWENGHVFISGIDNDKTV